MALGCFLPAAVLFKQFSRSVQSLDPSAGLDLSVAKIIGCTEERKEILWNILWV